MCIRDSLSLPLSRSFLFCSSLRPPACEQESAEERGRARAQHAALQVFLPSSLPTCYAMPGTDIRICYAMPGTDVRICCAMSGTETRYHDAWYCSRAPTHPLRDARYWHTRCPVLAYALPGTDVQTGPTTRYLDTKPKIQNHCLILSAEVQIHNVVHVTEMEGAFGRSGCAGLR
eukprot:2446261-Rhodomonas_salina.1